MLALIQDALTDTLCVVFGTQSRTPVARCLCNVQDLGPEWLVEAVEVVKPSKSLFQRHIMISQSVRIPLLPAENTHHPESLGMQTGGWQGHQLYFSSEEPQVWLLVLCIPTGCGLTHPGPKCSHTEKKFWSSFSLIYQAQTLSPKWKPLRRRERRRGLAFNEHQLCAM